MSTARLMLRIPAVVSRRRIHSGLAAAGSIPRTSRAANRSQPIGSSTATGYGGSSVAPGAPMLAGSRSGTPNACDSSRAMPRADSAYPRSVVISRSSTMSSRPTTGRASSPGSTPADGASTMMPV